MNIFKHAIFLLIFYIYSLAHAIDSGANFTRNAGASGKEIACPARDFSEFIKVFSRNMEVQMAFTKYPLKYVQILDAASEPLPRQSIKFLTKEQIKFPLIHDEKELVKYGLKLLEEKIDEETSMALEVSLGKKSLGHYIEYIFKREKSCWKLVEVNDQST